MDVSKSEKLDGEKLVQAVVSLSGLPERDAHDELDRILQLSGTSTGELTLDGLRAAMLAYLETLAESMPADSDADNAV